MTSPHRSPLAIRLSLVLTTALGFMGGYFLGHLQSRKPVFIAGKVADQARCEQMEAGSTDPESPSVKAAHPSNRADVIRLALASILESNTRVEPAPPVQGEKREEKPNPESIIDFAKEREQERSDFLLAAAFSREQVAQFDHFVAEMNANLSSLLASGTMREDPNVSPERQRRETVMKLLNFVENQESRLQDRFGPPVTSAIKQTDFDLLSQLDTRNLDLLAYLSANP